MFVNFLHHQWGWVLNGAQQHVTNVQVIKAQEPSLGNF